MITKCSLVPHSPGCVTSKLCACDALWANALVHQCCLVEEGQKLWFVDNP